MVFNSVQDGSLPSVSISSFTKPFHLRVHTDDLEGKYTPTMGPGIQISVISFLL